MMKWLLIIAGFLVLSIIGLGGLLWAAGNRPIDPQSEFGQDYARTFKQGITAACTRYVATEASRRYVGDLEELTKDICGCAADLTYNTYKHHPPVKLLSIVNDLKMQNKLDEIWRECVERADP